MTLTQQTASRSTEAGYLSKEYRGRLMSPAWTPRLSICRVSQVYTHFRKLMLNFIWRMIIGSITFLRQLCI